MTDTNNTVLTDDQWVDLAQRHANSDWNSDQPDGYLNAVKALCQDFLSILPAASEAGAVPVAYRYRNGVGSWTLTFDDSRDDAEPLYAAPPSAPAAQPEKQAGQDDAVELLKKFMDYRDADYVPNGLFERASKIIDAAPPAPSQQADNGLPWHIPIQHWGDTDKAALTAPSQQAAPGTEPDDATDKWRIALELIALRQVGNPAATATNALLETGFWHSAPAAESANDEHIRALADRLLARSPRAEDIREAARFLQDCYLSTAATADAAESAEPVTGGTVSELLDAIRHYGSEKWSEGNRHAIAVGDDRKSIRAAWDDVYRLVQLLANQPTAATADAQATKPAKRPYNASGSLSEYGVFPMCDVPTETADAQGKAFDPDKHNETNFHLRFADAQCKTWPAEEQPDGTVTVVDPADMVDAQGDELEDAYVIERLGKLLAGVAVALKGPEKALQRHSYHDLPEVAQQVMVELGLHRARERQHGRGDERAACAAAYAEQSANRRTDERDFEAGWECAIEWVQARAALSRQPSAAASAVVSNLHALAKEWMADQAGYPDTEIGRHAAAAVKCCANELCAALAAAKPEGGK